MASEEIIRWRVSHRFRGIVTTMDGLIRVGMKIGHINQEYGEMLLQQIQKWYALIEEFTRILSSRAEDRHEFFTELMQMHNTLEKQLTEGEMDENLKQLLLTEIEVMCEEVIKQIEINKDLDKK